MTGTCHLWTLVQLVQQQQGPLGQQQQLLLLLQPDCRLHLWQWL